MKYIFNKYFILLCLSLSFFSLTAQERYIVTSIESLNLRSAPNIQADILYKVDSGTPIFFIEKTTNKQSINTKDGLIDGHWVKVQRFDGTGTIDSTTCYVLDAFIQKEDAYFAALEKEIQQHEVLNDYEIFQNPIYTGYVNSTLKGDFFGDGIPDIAIQMKHKHKDHTVHIVILNHNETGSKPYILDKVIENGKPKEQSFGWAAVFKNCAPGYKLYSNWNDEEEDYQSLDDLSHDAIIQLDYHAFYLHNMESCGGGFVYWKDGNFHWLQQE